MDTPGVDESLIVQALYYPKNDHKDIGMLGAKGDMGFFIGYFANSRTTSGCISSGLDLTYAPSIITSQKQTEYELGILFGAIYDDYIGGQPLDAPRTAPTTLANQILQIPNPFTTTTDSAPTLTNSSSQVMATNNV
ncbi:hypothetical protein Tco_1365531 [Tanacetum coccineum]